MLAMKFTGKERIELIELPKPGAQGSNVVVRVMASGICGTDIELLYRSEKGSSVVPGHEIAGQVVDVGESERVKIGDRVVINCHITCGQCEYCRSGDLIFCNGLKVVGFDVEGGNQEYLSIPDQCCQILPDDVSYEVGVLLTDALGTSYHAVRKSGLKKGDRVGVFGVGPLGLLAVLIAVSMGGEVMAIDLNDYRLDFARKMGAGLAINPKFEDPEQTVLELTNGRGLDVALECAGTEKTINYALNLIKNRGRVILVGVCLQANIRPLDQIIFKEAEIYGSRNYNINKYSELLEFVRANPLVKEIITHKFKLEEAQKAYETAVGGKCGKVIFNFGAQ